MTDIYLDIHAYISLLLIPKDDPWRLRNTKTYDIMRKRACDPSVWCGPDECTTETACEMIADMITRMASPTPPDGLSISADAGVLTVRRAGYDEFSLTFVTQSTALNMLHIVMELLRSQKSRSESGAVGGIS